MVLLLVASILAPTPAAAAPPDHLAYFGYVAIDCGWHDPYDPRPLRNTYVEEVASFTNLNHMCIYDYRDRVVSRLQTFVNADMRALLHVQAVFWEYLAPSRDGRVWKRFPDWRERWATFVGLNQNALDADHVGTLYIFDEPFNAGIPYRELREVSDVVKATFPSIPVSFVEAWSALYELRVPPSVDWIGFDDYIQEPNTDPVYLEQLATLKARRSRADQKVIIVMAAFWDPFMALSIRTTPPHAYPPARMGVVARNYYTLGANDPDVVAIIGYVWPGGLDGPQELGTRDLPAEARAEHRRIGRAITGK